MKQFKEGEQTTKEEHNVNSAIMEKACEIAHELTEKECEIRGIDMEQEEDEETRYTEEAQDIFNNEYDRQMTLLYDFVNEIMKITHPTKESEMLKNASHYLSDGDLSTAEMVETIRNHPDQNEMIDYVDGVVVWQPLKNSFTCAAFLELIGG